MRTILLALTLAASAPAESGKTPQAIVQAAPQKAQPLTDEEAQDLQQRDEKPNEKVAGGALSNEHLTYIVIALAAAVLVLVLK
jgi:hypothetical protein